MNRGPEPGHASSKPRFTQKQGQYLAFIHAYTLVLGRPPAEADLRRHFRVTPPSVHQMLITLEREGLLRLDKLSYDIHMVAEEMLQRGMIDVEASGSVEIGSAAHRSGQAIAAWRATGGSGTST
jgi:hypothetical protein